MRPARGLRQEAAGGGGGRPRVTRANNRSVASTRQSAGGDVRARRVAGDRQPGLYFIHTLYCWNINWLARPRRKGKLNGASASPSFDQGGERFFFSALNVPSYMAPRASALLALRLGRL
ncbi:hypothetical protein EVAR_18860_1 [Eumeta japonica]|uniref:Uncharacterized protein n=1 Tax=Eumeta variegata TaxID=151549 RepID=A0A4C1ULN5_EUMVA|nr:hypothetical protein EVAR_18860_1 [Eumeta japonica]